ncbi:hypothetical protein L1987_27457 [Smallanthus sonchifolius]|uniref:Uncharacterized protein n=1 Tax=Smallanthus sonchifolius TaxID=185202 RepID=A0ACB9IBV6_9ASTR|nr:hypothetical protein L1987_27457 [Smallanthus sonchifolius]
MQESEETRRKRGKMQGQRKATLLQRKPTPKANCKQKHQRVSVSLRPISEAKEHDSNMQVKIDTRNIEESKMHSTTMSG